MLPCMLPSMVDIESRKRNAGVLVMVIQASNTRMGGYFISKARTY